MNVTNLSNAPWVNHAGDGKITINTNTLYEYLRNNLLLKITNNRNFYLYEDNLWMKISSKEFKAMIKDYLPVQYRAWRHIDNVWKEFSTDHADMNEDDFNNNENIVGFENGVINLKTMELEEHSPDNLLTRVVHCNYLPNQDIRNAPVFHEYLSNLCDNDMFTMIFMLEYFGAILSNVKGWRYKKMLLLTGAGNTGKTQIRELITNILGEENCASTDIKTINERFGTSLLYGKRLCGSGDMDFLEVNQMNVIKELTGGDKIFGEFKGKTGFTFRYDGLLWFNTNKLPYFRGDRNPHLYERFEIVNCQNIVPVEKRDSLLIDKLMSERDVICSIAVDYFKDTVTNGYKFTESEGMKQEREKYSIENNSLLSFVNTCCSINQNEYQSTATQRSVFNSIYEKWCVQNRVKPERSKDRAELLMYKYGIIAKKKNGIFYYNLVIRDDAFDDNEKLYMTLDSKF